MRLGFWIKDWCYEFFYGFGDFDMNLSVIRKWKKSVRLRLYILWELLLLILVYKWNVDGVLKGKLGSVGIGGVLRDFYGGILCIFFMYIGVKDLNVVEFMVIVYVLEILV